MKTAFEHFVVSGHLTKAPCYNAIYAYLAQEGVLAPLHDLVRVSAAPLALVEPELRKTVFAADGTGFSTKSKVNYFEARYGTQKRFTVKEKGSSSSSTRSWA